MKARDLFIGLFTIALLAAAGYVWLAPAGVTRAPEVRFATTDGARQTLSGLRGRPVLVTFWATTCSTCVTEMPHLVDLHHELSPRGFEILALAMDYDVPQDIAALVRARQLPYLVAHDAEGEAARAFGDVRVTPTSFLLSPDGVIVRRTQGAMDMAQLRAQILSMLPEPPRTSL